MQPWLSSFSMAGQRKIMARITLDTWAKSHRMRYAANYRVQAAADTGRMARQELGAMQSFRYSRWDGSQNVVDLEEDDVMEELSDYLLAQGDLSSALRMMMQRG